MRKHSGTVEESRRGFLGGAAAFAAAVPLAAFTGCQSPVPVRRDDERQSELISKWNEATEAISPQVYAQYMRDGDIRGSKVLDSLELAFNKVMCEARQTVVTGDTPAVWSVYNMGYVVKTRQSLFQLTSYTDGMPSSRRFLTLRSLPTTTAITGGAVSTMR